MICLKIPAALREYNYTWNMESIYGSPTQDFDHRLPAGEDISTLVGYLIAAYYQRKLVIRSYLGNLLRENFVIMHYFHEIDKMIQHALDNNQSIKYSLSHEIEVNYISNIFGTFNIDSRCNLQRVYLTDLKRVY